jgi:UDP-N-acetylmuramate--L-alanine ligase/UDP-N-acetylenolpyruvoylglucosamine reductase
MKKSATKPDSRLDLAKIAPGAHFHMVGICGVGMAGVAALLAARGYRVTGCDSAPNHLADWLRARAIEVHEGHDAAHLDPAVDVVVRSTAVLAQAPEIVAADGAGVPVYQRGEVLPALLEGRTSIVVTGTHGKSTTAGFVAQMLDHADCAPDYCLGCEVPALEGVAAGRDSDVIVAEGDESDGTIRRYAPDILVVTNVEFDHMEHFDDVAAFEECFRCVAARTRRCVVCCADDARAVSVCSGAQEVLTYALDSVADVRGIRVEGSDELIVQRGTTRLGALTLPAPGRHNALNALAAVTAGLAYGLDFEAIAAGLATAELPRRRFETLIEAGDLRVVSDYAHHPTEIRALLDMTQHLSFERRLVVYQPHRYTRTRALADDFPAAFDGADEVILTPVYAACEEPLRGGTSWDLYACFRRLSGVRVSMADSLEQAEAYVRRILRPGDLLLIVGAGDVETIGHHLREDLAVQDPPALNPVPGLLAGIRQLALADTAIRQDEPLGPKTTLKVGGRADILLDVGVEQDLASILGWAHAGDVPVHIMGAGSNVLVSDLGVRGLVVRLIGNPFREIEGGTDEVRVGARVSNRALLSWAENNDCQGFDFLEGIPGTVGGAMRMNAGAWGGETANRVKWVRCLAMDGKSFTFNRAELDFQYRGCPALADKIVVQVGFSMSGANGADVDREEIAARRAWWKQIRSAGSVFRNPDGAVAGELIERAGLKGCTVGGARIFETHANVIATVDGARAADVRALIERARRDVKDQFDVELQPEVVFLQ